MSIFKPPDSKTYRYKFSFRGRTYRGTTYQTTASEAQLAEDELKRRLRHEAGGITAFFPEDTPRFADWIPLFLQIKRQQISRPDHLVAVTNVLLRFFGARPKTGAITGEPYHDLRLGHVIADPSWILRFEDWMRARGIGAQSKKHYRSVLRRLYALAMLPQYRQQSGVTSNPFVGIPNDPIVERTVALTPEQARAWLSSASYYVRLAMAIAALAPKLRLAKVLGLRWAEHFDPDPRSTKFDASSPHFIVLRDHKTVRRTGRVQAMPISSALLAILKDAHRRHPSAASVIVYQGRQVHSIHDGVKAAAVAAGIPYGRAVANGATFHTLRHTAATLLSIGGIDPLTLKDAMGHTDLRTTLKYRHLKPEHERPAIEQLAATLDLGATVTIPRTRPAKARLRPGTKPGTAPVSSPPKLLNFLRNARGHFVSLKVGPHAK